MTDFIHLHLHSEFSLLDGAVKVDDLLEHCVQNNIDAVAITDHGNMYSCLNFSEKAKKLKIKAIVGCELYMCDDLKKKDDSKYEHLVLLAKNEIGYKNIIKLDSIAFVDGFYYKPRVDYKTLKEHNDGVICLSACLAGKIPQLLLKKDYEGAVAFAKEMKQTFGEDFYIEIQDHGIPEQKMILPLLIKLANELDIQLVATNDVHYLNKEDWEAQDVLMCIQTKRTLDDPKRMKFDTHEFYMKSGDEMLALFPNVPQAISNTRVIADKCVANVFNLKDDGTPIKDNTLIPGYEPPDGSKDPEAYLRKLTDEGLIRRYGKITEEIAARRDKEFDIIIPMGFAEYFLIVMDFIKWSKDNGIPVGPGRGSGAASIVAYAIGITDIEPLKYDLIFERFLNKDRVSMPDFDVDFCTERRLETVEYVRKKYHPENVAQIVTFGTMKAKMVVKDVGRVMRVPYSETDKLTKLMDGKSTLNQLLGRNIAKMEAKLQKIDKASDPDKYDDALKKLEEEKTKKNKDLIDIYETDDTLHKVVDMSLKLEGMPRNTSEHAAGVVICRKPISDNVPLSRNGEDVTTQFNMKEVESIGMLKMDFLALATLTDIKKTCDYIYENHGIKIDFDKISYDDQKVYDLIRDGDTDAVFQLEQGGMKKFMKNLKPTCIEDLIAGISLYRPGPMQYIDEYCIRKEDPTKVKYDDPQLESILNYTNGIIVYQEQVMQIFQKLAGYSLGQADVVRAAMGKKKRNVIEAEKAIFLYGDKINPEKPYEYVNEKGVEVKHFREGAIARGVPEAVAKKIYADMELFAGYAFNKAHATCYAIVGYHTAYLKRYYFKEFMAGILNNRITKIDEIIKYLLYLKEKNVPIYSPDINKSRQYFHVEKDGIRVGLAALKGVGISAVDEILKERENGEFKDFSDFCARCSKLVNKRMVETFIYAGAFDCFGKFRSQLMAVYDGALEKANALAKEKNSDQLTLFGDFIKEDINLDINYPNIAEWETTERLSYEKTVMGVYLSGHPFENYKDKITGTNFSCEKLLDFEVDDETGEKKFLSIEDNQSIVMGGIISDFKRKTSKTGNPFATVDLDDTFGSINCLAFGKTFDKIKDVLEHDKVVIIKGRLRVEGESKPVVMLDSMVDFNDDGATSGVEEQTTSIKNEKLNEKVLWINANNIIEKEYDALNDILGNYPGKTRVKVYRNGKVLMFPIGVDEEKNGLMSELLTIVDEADIKIK